MHSSTHSRLAVPLAIATALVGLYFVSASAAEARVGSIGLDRAVVTTMASSTKSRPPVDAPARGINNPTASSTASSTKPRPQVDATCMSAAVEARETALIAAWSDLNTALTAVLTDRKADLVAAWTLTDVTERGKALKAAWGDWRAARKSADSEFRSDRKAAWDEFKKTSKDQCKLKLPKEEALEKGVKDSMAI